ncbi:hypothetical protein [Nocardia colli]|uniref:hypothetical protein n=1 Tax=Nocardia colli TaxID=2545717 RepID=UPI0035D73F0A
MSNFSYRPPKRFISVAAAIVFLGSPISMGTAAVSASAESEPKRAHCWLNRMERPRLLGEKIIFDASVKCDPKPRDSYFEFKLIKVDHPSKTEHDVETREYHNPPYFLEDGFSFTEYHDCSINPETRIDGYYSSLHIFQYDGLGVADLIVDNKPPVNLSC